MNKHNRIREVSVALSLMILLAGSVVHAAPSLGVAETFGILSSTYTNTVPGTTVNGDLGYTTGPAMAPTVNGTTYTPGTTYAQAGSDQAAALAELNDEFCTFTFPAGAVDLAANVQFPTATYGPGIYCIAGAASVGAGGITLTGTGTYLFRMTGALDSVAASDITLADGASECDIWWTPIGATTLGANSTFKGTVIGAPAITIGANVTWDGRALAFGGTVTSDADTISAPSCIAAVPVASLTLTKTVVNDDTGTSTVSDFPLFVGASSMASGVATTTLAPGAYTVTEVGSAGYAASVWGGDCAADGTITLGDGDIATCTITNDDIAAAQVPSASLTVTKIVVNDDGGTSVVSDFPLFIGVNPVTSGIATTTLAPGVYTVSETGNSGYIANDWGGDCDANGSILLADGDVATCTITNDDVDETDSDDDSNGNGGGGGGNSSNPTVSSADEPSSDVMVNVSNVANGVPGLPNAGLEPHHTIPHAAVLTVVFGYALAAWSSRKRSKVMSTDGR